MGVFSVLVMIGLVFLMTRLRKMKNQVLAKKLSFFCFGFVILFSIFAACSFNDDGSSEMRKKSLKFYISQGYVLGQKILKDCGKNKNILVVTMPSDLDRDRVKDLVDELDDESDANKTRMVKIGINEEKMEQLYDEKLYLASLDAIDFGNSDVIVFLFEPNYKAYIASRIAEKTADGKLHTYFIGAVGEHEIQELIRQRKVNGGVKMKDGFNIKDSPKSDPAETFKLRYVLLP